MANRDVSNYRSSIQQVAPVAPAPQPNTLIQGIAEIGKKIITQNQEAKITENFSKAQLDLSRLNQKYQTDFESNPFGGLDDLKQQRDDILKGYGEQISPFFQGAWQENTRKLAFQDDATTEAWAYKQTKVNTVRSVNESIKANMSQAALDGERFGDSDQDEVGSTLNFAQTRNKIAGFASTHLGQGTATDLLESYDEDYLKSFISGVSDKNPLKALKLMDDPGVQGGFKDHKQFSKMKEAVEARALNVQEIQGQKEILNVLKDENSLLVKSLDKPMSYADLQAEFDRSNMSTSARSFFMKANGYTKSDGTQKLSQSEQLEYKANLYNGITDLSKKETVSAADISSMQDKIYSGMDRGALTEAEGVDYLNQLVTPYATKQEAQLTKFSKNNWFTDDIGFSGLQKMYDENIEIKPGPDDKEVGPLTQSVNNSNKVKLYDYYNSALQAQAKPLNIKVGDIPDLPSKDKQKIYSAAQSEAMKLYMQSKYPELGNMETLPNNVIPEDGGRVFTGAQAGAKADQGVTVKFKIMKDANGNVARVYENGKIEEIK